MKTKVMLYVSILTAMAISIVVSCKKKANVKNLNGVYIVPLTGKSAVENKIVLYSTIPYKFPLATAISTPVTSNVDVTISVDNTLVDTYNIQQKTSYSVMPAGSYTLEATSLTIPKDGIASNQTNLLVKANMLTADVSYLLPVKVGSVSAGNITLNAAIGTKYYIIRSPTPVVGNLSNGKNSYWKNPSASFNAPRGNDGNTNGEWGGGSVCESGAGLEQYWEVDLGSISPRIDDVKIWNRTDCCDDRTAKFYLFISDVPFTSTTVAGSLAQQGVYSYYNDDKAGVPTQVIPKVSGRYIRLQNTTSASLTLAELTAIGIKP